MRGDHIVLYDGNCGFCKWMMAGVLAWDRRARIRPVALQQPEAERLTADLSPAVRMASWHLIEPDGTRRSGGEAIAPLLRLMPGGAVAAAPVARMPATMNRGYGWVATHRMQISRWVPSRLKQRASAAVARVQAERSTRPPG